MIARAFLICIHLVLPMLLKAQSSSLKPVNTKVLIDSMARALVRTYIFPEKSRIISDHLKSQLRKGAYKSITDPESLAAKLDQDIQSVHHDGHLRVRYDPDFAQMPPSVRARPQSPDSIQLQQAKSENFRFKKVEILNGNIGYVQFTGFSEMIEVAKPVIRSAFRFLSNTNAIIIDLRKNGGGNPHMVKHIASYFVSERTRLNDIYDRRVNKTMEFWAEPSDADNMKLTMPLYILTSKQTFSAAEDFTYAMQVNKRAVIVGEASGGGAHPTGPVYIGQNFVVAIPFARSINHITQTDWEGTGVVPDIRVSADSALIKAQELILTARFANATEEEQKRSVRWLINALHARLEYDNIDIHVLKTFEGEYGRFKVYVKEDVLMLDDFTGRTFRLKPIKQNHFLGDDWFQVEFISGDGKITQMKMSGEPGWVDMLDRN